MQNDFFAKAGCSLRKLDTAGCVWQYGECQGARQMQDALRTICVITEIVDDDRQFSGDAGNRQE